MIAIHPLAEMRHFVSVSIARAREAGWLRALAYFRVISNIEAEATKHANKLSDSAHAAEQYDLEAVRALKAAMSDGKLDESDKPTIELAMRNITRSAALDHDISEKARVV